MTDPTPLIVAAAIAVQSLFLSGFLVFRFVKG